MEKIFKIAQELENGNNSKSIPMKLVLTNCGDVKADGIEIERHTEIKKELKVN